MKPTLQGMTHIPREDDDQEAGGLVLRPPTSGGGDVRPFQDDRQAPGLASKGAADPADARRQQALKALAGRLAELQARLSIMREATRDLSAIEIERRLKPDETRRARSLRWESERLSHELKLLRQSFEALAAESRASGSN
jgi:hypothetical protein